LDAQTDMLLPTMNTGSVVLEVSNLTAGYFGRPVVQNVDLTIREGEFVGLVGHNGSGKSTIFHGIAGLTWAHAERIVLLNKNMLKLPTFKRSRHGLGLLLQRDGTFPDLPIEANLSIAGDSDTGAVPPFGDLAERLKSILRRRKENAGVLSGGERRLLSMALILKRQPAILLADEPTLGLSEELELAVMEFLRDYASGRNRAVLVVSHNLPLVEALCNRTYIIGQGTILHEFRSNVSNRSLEDHVRKCDQT